MEQKVLIIADGDYRRVTGYLESNDIRNIFLVCSGSYQKLQFGKYMSAVAEEKNISISYFMDFKPNPDISSVDKGAAAFRQGHYDAILVVGGGSGMDVAKCIKNELEDTPLLIAVPTTAGTGSEATRFAVVYKDGEKQSVENEKMLPDLVILDSSCLDSLPLYQRKVTMLDAICHSIESYWSVNSTKESRRYASEALRSIMSVKDDYLENRPGTCIKMLQAANMAGKAINISKTTAGHALCYKITKLYDVPHGYAAAKCLSEVWRYMVDNTGLCIDGRGLDYFKGIMLDLSVFLGGQCIEDAPAIFDSLLKDLRLDDVRVKEEDIEVLVKSVNTQRLGNHPVRLDDDAIEMIYRRMMF